MDRFFHVTEKGSTIRTEIMAGITTFMAMAYILMVNAGMFSNPFGDGTDVLGVIRLWWQVVPEHWYGCGYQPALMTISLSLQARLPEPMPSDKHMTIFPLSGSKKEKLSPETAAPSFTILATP